MGFFRRQSTRAAVQRLSEEQLFEAVASELAEGIKRPGLWARALADAEGDGARAEGLYIRLRAQSILDENHLAEEEEAAQQEARAERLALQAKRDGGRREFKAVYENNGRMLEAVSCDGQCACFACAALNHTQEGRLNPLCGDCGARLPVG